MDQERSTVQAETGFFWIISLALMAFHEDLIENLCMRSAAVLHLKGSVGVMHIVTLIWDID